MYDLISLKQATAFSDSRAGKHDPPKTIRGWWKMRVADLHVNKMIVEHAPIHTEYCNNDYHAEIIFPEGHCDSWEDAEVQLLCFISNGSWQDIEKIDVS